MFFDDAYNVCVCLVNVVERRRPRDQHLSRGEDGDGDLLAFIAKSLSDAGASALADAVAIVGVAEILELHTRVGLWLITAGIHVVVD